MALRPSVSRVQTAKSKEIYLCVCVCVWERERERERETGLLEKKKSEQRRRGGCIIGFSAARRHNDTAIDSGMSSWERSTNERAKVCFSQPLIGCPWEAVGLQVANLPFPSTSSEEGMERLSIRCDLSCEENKMALNVHSTSAVLFWTLPTFSYLHILSPFDSICYTFAILPGLSFAPTLPGLCDKQLSFVLNLARSATAPSQNRGLKLHHILLWKLAPAQLPCCCFEMQMSDD